MKLAHDRAFTILGNHAEQMHTMSKVLIERETVEGQACDMLLENKWDEYLKNEKAGLTKKSKSEDKVLKLKESEN